MSERPPAQVRRVEGIAQQVVTVKLEERVQVEERLDPRSRHHQVPDRVDRGAALGDPPRQGGERPQDQLEPGSGRGHREPLVLLGEQPGVADVAVERRLQVEEHDPELGDLAAEAFAGQAVRELVRGGHQEDGQHQDRNHGRPVDPQEVRAHLAPVADRDRHGQEHQRERGDPERSREQRTRWPHEAAQQAIRVADPEAQVERRAGEARSGADSRLRPRIGLDQPGAPQLGEKALESRRGERCAEVLLDPPANLVGRRRAVTLLDDEALELAQAEETPAHRVLDHQHRSAGGLLPADHEIAAELRMDHGPSPSTRP